MTCGLSERCRATARLFYGGTMRPAPLVRLCSQGAHGERPGCGQRDFSRTRRRKSAASVQSSAVAIAASMEHPANRSERAETSAGTSMPRARSAATTASTRAFSCKERVETPRSRRPAGSCHRPRTDGSRAPACGATSARAPAPRSRGISTRSVPPAWPAAGAAARATATRRAVSRRSRRGRPRTRSARRSSRARARSTRTVRSPAGPGYPRRVGRPFQEPVTRSA